MKNPPLDRESPAAGTVSSSLLVVLLALSMISWGGSWISAKLIADAVAAEVIVFWRFLITFAGFIPLVLLMRQNLRVSLRTLGLLVAASILLVLYNKFFFTGVRTGLAGAGGVLVTSTTPIITFALSLIFHRQQVTLREVFGLLLGLAGSLILLKIWNLSWDQLLRSGNLFFLFCAVSWSILTLVSQETQRRISFLVYSFYVYGISMFIDFFLALPFGIGSALRQDTSFWLNMFYISLISTSFAITIFFYASSRLGSRRAGSFVFIVPTSALLFSWFFLGEVPAISTLTGGALTISAVYLINRKGRTR